MLNDYCGFKWFGLEGVFSLFNHLCQEATAGIFNQFNGIFKVGAIAIVRVRNNVGFRMLGAIVGQHLHLFALSIVCGFTCNNAIVVGVHH